MDKTIEKYNEWVATGGPPYLTDEELLSVLNHFGKLRIMLRGMKGYDLALRAINDDWWSLHLVAKARGLETKWL